MLYWNFEVMKSIWRYSPNKEPVPFGIDSILDDFASLIKEWCHFFLFHGWLVNLTLHASGKLDKIKPFIRTFFE